ncbi:hypothetical protein [Chlorobium limicola]
MRKTTGIPAMHVRKVRGAHAHCGRYVGAAPACDLPLSGRYTAAQSLAVSAAVMLLCRKKRKNPASRRASGCHAACKESRQAARHPFADYSTQRYTAAVMPLAGKKRKRPAGVVENRMRFASESAALPAMAQSATTAHPRRALQKLSRFAFFRKGRSLPLYSATAKKSAFVCAAHCSPLQKKFARLQGAAVPPGNGSQTQSLPPWQTPFLSSAALLQQWV